MKIFLFAILAIPLLAASCSSQTPLKQSCPNEWIRDEMPGSDSPNEYFIFNGKQVEVSGYDIKWVEKNCSVKKQVVS